MKRIALAGCVAVMLAGVGVHASQEGSPMPKPVKEHEWLQQIVGEWDAVVEVKMDPAKPPEKSKGTESGRMIGGFWAVIENRGEMMGAPFTGILTLGFDPDKKKYVGTWVDSMSSYLWRYEGTVDPTGKILTLETEGPSFEAPGKMCKFVESTELKGKDHKVFTSKFEKDGKWVTAVTIDYTRKK